MKEVGIGGRGIEEETINEEERGKKGMEKKEEVGRNERKEKDKTETERYDEKRRK